MASMAHTPDDLTLWYEQPAVDGETQALPIGPAGTAGS